MTKCSSLSMSGTFPIVDYSAHPAFRSFAQQTDHADSQMVEAFAKIDRAYQAIAFGSPYLTRAAVNDYFHQEIDPAFEHARHACRAHLMDDPALSSWVESALEGTRNTLVDAVNSCIGARRYKTRRTTVNGQMVFDQMKHHGVAVMTLPPAALKTIWDGLCAFRQKLVEKREADPRRHCWVSLPLQGRWWWVLRSLLRREGAVEGAAEYRRQPFRITYCALVLSHPGESWNKGCYEDVRLPTPKTTYMHVDEDLDMIKMVIYLGEVGPSQGPFSYIRGSHKWDRSFSQFCFFKQLEREVSRGLAGVEPTDSVYHRPQFKMSLFRRRFMTLPKPLRGASHFGDDILDGSPLSEYLLGSESTFLSTEGNCLIFDGGTGIHRGGIVQQGERWALQVGLQNLPRPSWQKQAITTGRFVITESLRYLLGENLVQKVKTMVRKPV